MATPRCLWADPEQKKCRCPESKDLSLESMGEIQRGQHSSEARRLVIFEAVLETQAAWRPQL